MATVPARKHTKPKKRKIIAPQDIEAEVDKANAMSIATKRAKTVAAKRLKDVTRRQYSQKWELLSTEVIKMNGGVHNLDYDSEENFLRPPIPTDLAMAFFGRLHPPTNEQHRNSMTDGPDVLYHSFKSAGAFWSAMREVYRCYNVNMDPVMERFITDWRRGFSKEQAQFKKDGLMDTEEGKALVLYSDYCDLCERMLSSQNIFGWAYTVIAWNTVQRNETVASIRLEHIKRGLDCLSISMYATKSLSEEGRDIHIFANPFKPAINPILAIAVLIFGGFCKDSRLFGSNGDAAAISRKFLNELHKVAGDKNWGCHSLRKGPLSHMASLVDGPDSLAQALRALWKLPSVQGSYIKAVEDSGSDQHAGRTLAGLEYSSPNFGVLPPHFPQWMQFYKNAWDTLLPPNMYAPDEFKQSVLPLLLASLIQHHSFLQSRIDKNHSIFQSPVFLARWPDNRNYSFIQAAAPLISFGTHRCSVEQNQYHYDCHMTATGVPSSIAHIREMVEVSDKLACIDKHIKENTSYQFQQVCDQLLQQQQKQQHQQEQMQQQLNHIHNTLDQVLKRLSQTQQTVTTVTTTTTTTIQPDSSIVLMPPQPPPPPPPPTSLPQQQQLFMNALRKNVGLYNWRLPHKFKLSVAWIRHHLRDDNMNVPALRDIKQTNVHHEDIHNFKKVKGLLNKFSKRAVQSRYVNDEKDLCQKSAPELTDIMNKMITDVKNANPKNVEVQKITSDLSCTSVHTLFQKYEVLSQI